ncbi:MAG: SDR family oxidoreductase [Solirubrobacterales bacterium]|nr:SDR family oxidoreductase [Solirubrobacterales bacterium]
MFEPDTGAVLLTGATGFVGMEVLARYLEQGERELILLVRSDSDRQADQRVQDVLLGLFGPEALRYGARVQAVAADLTLPALGLGAARREELAERVTTIVHGAASVSFGLGLEQARAINVEGTRRMLELARLAAARGAGLRRFGYVSTAFVSGAHAGAFSEHDLELGQRFHNSYEQSKFEAESLVAETSDLPYTVLRPSIVVGDRETGWTAAFNVLYWPLRAIARGLLGVVPATFGSPVDVVSVDYVAAAIHALCEADAGLGQTFHLTEGRSASAIEEIAGAACGYFGQPFPEVLTPEEFAVATGIGTVSASSGASSYFPYFSNATVFENARTRAVLERLGIAPSPLRDYLERLLDFAVASRWGKAPITRHEASIRVQTPPAGGFAHPATCDALWNGGR